MPVADEPSLRGQRVQTELARKFSLGDRRRDNASSAGRAEFAILGGGHLRASLSIRSVAPAREAREEKALSRAHLRDLAAPPGNRTDQDHRRDATGTVGRNVARSWVHRVL